MSPLSLVRKGGSSLSELVSIRKVRRSLMEAISARLIAARSSASAIGSPWKLPAEMISPESGKMSGLSVTESTSTVTTRRSHSSASRQAPCTCGMQRSE